MPVIMHTTPPAIMSTDQTKNCIDEDKDGDVLKQETQDLAGLLSSPDSKPSNNSINANIKSDLNIEFKDMINDDKAIKQEPGNPLSVGKLPNGDVNTDIDKKVGTPDVKPIEKVKQESNGNPHTPILLDNQPQGPVSMGPMQHRANMSSMCMSPMSVGMGPHMGGPSMSQGVPMGLGPGIPNHQAMMHQLGPGSSQMMGPNGGLHQQQMASDGQLVQQQQSEIFVFTTQLANEAARAVQQGQYKNILSYHMDQPATKTFLQKNPKMRPGAAMFGMQSMRNKMGMMNNAMGTMSEPGGVSMGYGPGPGSNTSNSVAQWVQQQNQNLQELGVGMNDDPRMMMSNPNFSQMMMDERMFDDFGGSAMNNLNLIQSKVPNENLTPEQLQRREEHLASLRKIQQMLFPEQRGQQGYPQGGPGPGGQNMVPGDMEMYQQNMMSKRGMMSPQNMMGSPHGMMDSRQEMMTQEQFIMSQGMSQYGPGPHPQNMQNLSPAQREWMRLQQEYIAEKQAIRQQRPMGPNGPQMGPGQPPPSYYSSIAQKQRHWSVGMGSPSSPGMNGQMGSPAVSAPDLNDPIIFQSQQHKNSFSGMDVLGPMGPGPSMGPGGMDSMMQQQGSPLNHSMGGHISNMPGNLGMKNSVSLQRAGNPEQFVPDLPAPVSGSNVAAKPPPSYAQSQSTKRKRDDMEDLCKNLQPTPSPQHISYLNNFDGQELTIIKQFNTAYRDTNTNESQSSLYTQNNQMVNSPLLAPGSNKGPMSNSSQTSSGPLASPGPVNVSQGSGQGPGPSPMVGANMRLSHYDPQQQPPQNNSSMSNSPTPTGKPSLSNITSASLANLAKGVENLSNQMQQHMMQGGPFHSIQLQSQQQQQQQQQSMPSVSQGQTTLQSSQSTIHNQTAQSMAPISSQTSHSAPASVNNTFVNANLSIQQVNIHSVNNGGGASNYGGSNNNNNNNSSSSSSNSASMQVQQMSMEQTQMNMQQQSAGASMSQAGSMTQNSMTQSANMTQGSTSMHPAGPKMHSGSMGMKDRGYGGMGHPVHSRISPFAQNQNPQQVPTSGHPGSPGYAPGSMGNANVQIQPKAPNTIQYLPVNHSSMLPENKPMSKPDVDFISQFANPMVNMEGKVPTSKMQYFPGGNPYGPGGMGPGGDSRMGPSMGMGQDPRYGGQSMSDPRLIDPRMGPSMGGDPRMGPSMGGDPRMGPSMGGDPRMGPSMSGDPRMGPSMSGDPRMGPSMNGDPRMGPSMSGDPRMGPSMSGDPIMGPSMSGDPRMGPMGPSADPRMGRLDPRMGSDMGMGVDPRMGPAGMGPMSDPRMGPTGGSIMGMGPTSGHMVPMRPGSRGSPFTGPIGPAVQQSMMMRRGSPDLPLGGSNFSPDPMNPGMNVNSLGGPMSALSSMSSMSNNMMADPMCQMGGPTGSTVGPSMSYNSPSYIRQMGSPMMSGPGSMSIQVPGSRMQGPGMGGMSLPGPYSQQLSPRLRMSGSSMGPGPLSPGAPSYSPQFQQFQQQLYSQSRSRQMSPMDGMMGNPGGTGSGYGHMGPGMGAGMMNMHGPM